MLKEKVTALLNEVFEDDKSLFLIDFSITPDNKIKVIIDGDNGVSLKDCIAVSRHVEHNLDREETDFSLEVTSPGATEPIVNNRQFNKNKGRKLQVKTAEEKFEGELTNVAESGIALSWKAREPKPVGKGKVTVKYEKEIPFADIMEAKVMITF
ncbi:ribosome assembly cofactor RimP [Galbibacter pacificus]|uniref:Ribosome maturation factor RimP n=1 Tax=Galbibacter pacificus TaxID=2996052 RepID=A0ABT6FTG2_9FLAO|nr:ribosome assembly cofactor RimP [Galbibacter pacificus]MDG3583079.1 ribosome assembly cofactor RimP [Galbibacter pacificus]MDG3586560.1 ribosome assembly cofactor RimP [Galbibacter pacificus]